MEREGGLLACALREWKRDVRESGAVGVPLLRSNELSNMEEISSVTVPFEDGTVDGCSREGEDGSSFAAAADISRRDRVVVKDREERHWLRCVRQCRTTGEARCAVGARKDRRGCDDRSSASPQRIDSIGDGLGDGGGGRSE